MGIYSSNTIPNKSHEKTRKVFAVSNYTLLAAASSCIFLTLSLRLIPSLCGAFFLLLQLLTIVAAVSGSSAAASASASHRWYALHMVAAVLTAVFQGSVSVLIFTSSDQFLQKLDSYVRESDAVKILRLVGCLCAIIFCLEWLVLTLSLFLKYYAVVDGGDARCRGVQEDQPDQPVGNWPPFKVQV